MSFETFIQRHRRVLALSPAHRAQLAAWQLVRDDAEHARWAASGAPDLLADLQAKRTADRIAAELEKQAIDRERDCVEMADSSEQECEAAQARHTAATVAWHQKYDRLFPAVSMAKAARRFVHDQQTYFAKHKDVQVSVIPFPVPSLPEGTPLPEHPNLTAPQAAALEDFVAYLPMPNAYCYLPTRAIWPGTSVNSKLGDVMVNGCMKIKAATWLAQYRSADAMAWSPGEPLLVRDRVLVDGGWINKPGDTTLNTYRPAAIEPREGDVSSWLNHIKTIYPEDWQHIINWLAHRVQRPGEKINHALVLGGEPGIGKDSLLEPIKPAVGAWNFCDVSPANIMGRFNGHLKSIVLRISEVHDLGDVDRFAFYERTKPLCAAPPDTHRIDEKNMKEYQAVNVCGSIMTTNYKIGGLYLPPNDRRHYVAWSSTPTGFFPEQYFIGLYRWFAEGGNEIVAHYLTTLDISAFNPKATPPKTPAFWEIANASRSPEAAEMDDALDAIGTRDADGNIVRLKAVTLAMVSARATGGLAEMLRERKYRTQVAHRMSDAGYEMVPNPTAKDGLWTINSKRQGIYAPSDLSTREKVIAAMELQNRPLLPPPPLPSQSV
jgi:hypothetical protein